MQKNILKRVLWIAVSCFLVFAVVKGVLFWNKISASMRHAKNVMVRDFQETVSQIDKTSYLSLDQQILVKELASWVSDEETSFFGVVLGGLVGWDALKDDQITQEEGNVIALVIDFLRDESGKVSFFEVLTFANAHPEVKKLFEKVVKAEKSQK